ncbi:hypothetical protein IEQ34_009495 [Dendrobium chrysotoxum]|uniref:Uncharacterized protein n=1 Tax=Dendrobium chrysotoxum TaxID=161865 RepID=A0AAV7H0V9_DENCH|nr:hypothetical protein IEQ34_009495 [Dendrobium chrysotoxum]
MCKNLRLQVQRTKKGRLSHITFNCWICDFSWLPSLLVTEQAITGLVTPQALPRACFEGTKTYDYQKIDGSENLKKELKESNSVLNRKNKQETARKKKFLGEKTFIGALLQLLIIGGLLDEVEDGDGQLRVRQRISLGIYCLGLQNTGRVPLLRGLQSGEATLKENKYEQVKRMERERCPHHFLCCLRRRQREKLQGVVEEEGEVGGSEKKSCRRVNAVKHSRSAAPRLRLASRQATASRQALPLPLPLPLPLHASVVRSAAPLRALPPSWSFAEFARPSRPRLAKLPSGHASPSRDSTIPPAGCRSKLSGYKLTASRTLAPFSSYRPPPKPSTTEQRGSPEESSLSKGSTGPAACEEEEFVKRVD